uniref:Uncharacterized protein n=3 Tax=Lygus hesperus TaxID=30085 RepID=A0A146KVH4_LYGHE
MCYEGLIEKLPQLETCCCCCRVETGSKIFAWLGVVAAFLYTIVAIFGIVTLATTGTGNIDPDTRDSLITVSIIVSILIILFLVCFWIVTILLLVGLYKEDMGKVRVWLKVNIRLLFIGIAGVSLRALTTGADPIVIVSGILQILISFYVLSVVKSHYQNKTQDIQMVMAEP